MKVSTLEELAAVLALANQHNVAVLELEGVRIVRQPDPYSNPHLPNAGEPETEQRATDGEPEDVLGLYHLATRERGN